MVTMPIPRLFQLSWSFLYGLALRSRTLHEISCASLFTRNLSEILQNLEISISVSLQEIASRLSFQKLMAAPIQYCISIVLWVWCLMLTGQPTCNLLSIISIPYVSVMLEPHSQTAMSTNKAESGWERDCMSQV